MFFDDFFNDGKVQVGVFVFGGDIWFKEVCVICWQVDVIVYDVDNVSFVLGFQLDMYFWNEVFWCIFLLIGFNGFVCIFD